MAYRSTPHKASAENPALLMLSRNIRTKLPIIELSQGEMDQEVRIHRDDHKEKMKKQSDQKNRVKQCIFQIGDFVYMWQT